MNLRVIHAVLIMFSAALAALFGVWCLTQYRAAGGVPSLLSAVAAFVTSAALLAYDSWFLRKTRTLR